MLTTSIILSLDRLLFMSIRSLQSCLDSVFLKEVKAIYSASVKTLTIQSDLSLVSSYTRPAKSFYFLSNPLIQSHNHYLIYNGWQGNQSMILILLLIIKIQQVALQMKPKKRTVPAQKKAEKKQAPVKPLMLIDKTTATTKQKTNTTIEDHFQITQFRNSIRTNKNLTPRNNCQQKLKDKDMSPFSSSGESISPKYRKIISPQPQEGKKAKQKSNLLLDKPCQKIKNQFVKREGKVREKVTKEQFNQANYQNLLLRRMDEKRITELSDQSSSSIPKISRLKLNIVTHQNKQKSPRHHQVKVSQLKNSIKSKYARQFPSLRSKELTFLCSIVLIQRFWRQNRIKNLINKYIEPKEVHLNIQSSLNKGKNTQQRIQEQTLELIRKYNRPSSPKIKNPFNKKDSLDLSNIDLSSQLNSQKQIKMIKFVQCLKDISFPKVKKQERKLKINIFSLKQSLSQNCLMQKLYGKILKVEQNKRNGLQLFGLKRQDKSLQRSIQLIKTMKTPQKIDIQQRFETQLEEKQSVEPVLTQISVSVQTDSLYFQPKQKSQLSTLHQLSLVTESVIFTLLNEFSEEFHSFTSRSILRKKKKVRMPGLKVDSNNIRQYLQRLSSYMLSQYGSEILRRWALIKPVSFLKLHHEYQEEFEDEDQQSDVPVIPSTIFYEYQLIYEQNIFKISEEDKKYCNFLEGLIKIHNILLANCMSEILQKTRMDRVTLPWDRGIHANQLYAKQDLQGDLNAITNTICRYSSMRIGQFHKRLDDPWEQKKVLRSINEEYKNEGNDWSAQYQYLQTRMELEKAIQEMLYLQAINDLTRFF